METLARAATAGAGAVGVTCPECEWYGITAAMRASQGKKKSPPSCEFCHRVEEEGDAAQWQSVALPLHSVVHEANIAWGILQRAKKCSFSAQY